MTRSTRKRPGGFPHSYGLGALLVALFGWAVGCTNTPIDAIVADETVLRSAPSSNASTPEDSVAPNCGSPTSVASSGVYQIRSQSGARCLSEGSETKVENFDAFEVDLVSPCEDTPEQLWELEPSVIRGAFVVRHLATDFVLDVERAAQAPLTPVVLFEAGVPARPNQSFYFYPRPGGFVEMVPAHTVSTTPLGQPAMCVSRFPSSTVIWDCSDSDMTQAWRLVNEACL